jgi:DNA-binding IclR family transcriptional regulator
MSHEIDVLRALLRLAPRRKSPTLDELVVRVGGDGQTVRRALFTLARGGLVQRTSTGLRLSLAGLAVAVAFGGSRGAGKRASGGGARAKPLPRTSVKAERRRRAA